jgi:hypothetical protein
MITKHFKILITLPKRKKNVLNYTGMIVFIFIIIFLRNNEHSYYNSNNNNIKNFILLYFIFSFA